MNQKIAIVIFGGTGDLAKKYLWQSAGEFSYKNNFTTDVIGIANRDRTISEFETLVRQSSVDSTWWHQAFYLNDDLDNPRLYTNLTKIIKNRDYQKIIMIIATSPEHFITIGNSLIKLNLIQEIKNPKEKISIIIEKPFGHDTDSARRLNDLYSQLQAPVYRIDHYLGKPALNSFMTLRDSNSEFNHLIKQARSIDLQFMEILDVDDRARYYDLVGAWKDVGQNHLIQLLTLAIMPWSNNKNQWHKFKLDTLASFSPFKINQWCCGQYESYVKIKNVNPDSTTETMFKIKLKSNNNIVATLQAGKATNIRETSFTYHFNNNQWIKFIITPDSAIEFSDELSNLELIKHFKNPTQNSAYTTIINAAYNNDSSKFVSDEEIIAQWQLSAKVSQYLSTLPLTRYPKGFKVDC